MDNYREVDLLPVKSVGASGTETTDIYVTEPLTAAYVYFHATNGAAVADEVPPERCIDKIEIVDGGKVYWSTSGPEAVAAAVYDTGQWPSHFYMEVASLEQEISIPLLFGRYIGDEEFAFSASKLLNPQIKITWTRNALHTTTGYTLGVRVKAMQGITPPTKALMVKNIRTFTSASTGVESTDLPVDQDYRRLFVRPYAKGTYWAEKITHFKLNCDVGKLIVFDIDRLRFLDLLKETFPKIEVGASICADNNTWKEGWLGNIEDCYLTVGTAGYIASTWAAFAGRYYQVVTTDAGGTLNDVDGQSRVFGYLPHTTLAYQFGRADDPASWFKASRYGQVKLELTQGGADIPVDILLQRPTPIP